MRQAIFEFKSGQKGLTPAQKTGPPAVKTTFAFILAILAFQGEASRTVAGDAFVPLNPPEMQPLTNRDSPAYRAARLFRHGVNLGNYLEVPPDENWGVTLFSR